MYFEYYPINYNSNTMFMQ